MSYDNQADDILINYIIIIDNMSTSLIKNILIYYSYWEVSTA